MRSLSIKNSFLCLLLLLFARVGFSAQKPVVILFGGHRATDEQMKAWQKSAESQLGHVFEFRAIRYPTGASSSRNSAINSEKDVLDRLIQEMNANPEREYNIAGHSSGSARSNYVAERASHPGRLRLFALDGFSPSAALQKRVRAQCWSASQGTLKALNFASTQNNCGPQFRDLKSQNCTTKMCLHFKLVNKKAPKDLGSDYGARGYKDVVAELDWLAGAIPSGTTSGNSSLSSDPKATR